MLIIISLNELVEQIEDASAINSERFLVYCCENDVVSVKTMSKLNGLNINYVYINNEISLLHGVVIGLMAAQIRNNEEIVVVGEDSNSPLPDISSAKKLSDIRQNIQRKETKAKALQKSEEKTSKPKTRRTRKSKETAAVEKPPKSDMGNFEGAMNIPENPALVDALKAYGGEVAEYCDVIASAIEKSSTSLGFDLVLKQTFAESAADNDIESKISTAASVYDAIKDDYDALKVVK